MIKINATQAFNLLQKVVAEAPAAFIYPLINDSRMCSYQAEGNPSCGVGQALFKAGVTLAQLKEMDEPGDTVDTDIYSLWSNSKLPADLDLTPGAVSVFDTFQRHQDKRLAPWSVSLAEAKTRYDLLTPHQEQ